MNQKRIVDKIANDFLRTGVKTIFPKSDRERNLVVKVLDVMKQGRYDVLKQYPQLVLGGLLENDLLKMHLDKETKKYLKKVAGMIETFIGNLVKYSEPSSFEDPANHKRIMELFKVV